MLKRLLSGRRSISFVVTITVLAGFILSPFMGINFYSASAKELPEATITSDDFQKTDTDATLKGETNLLYNRDVLSVFQNDNGSTNKTAYANSNKKIYTDGDLNTSTQLNGKIYYNADGTVRNTAPYTDPKYYTDVTYSFADNANVNEIWVYHHTNSTLATYAYQLYLSDSESTLYSADSLVATYVNENSKTYQKFKFANTIEDKKFFGLRILVATPTNTTLGAFARLTELAVIGELDPAETPDPGTEGKKGNVFENYTKSDTPSYELQSVGNLLYGRTYEEVYQNNNGTDNTAEASAQIKNNPNVLTDGITGTTTFFPGRIYYDDSQNPKNTAPFTDCKYYTDLTYSFAGEAEVHGVWLYHHTSDELITYAYEIYLSDSKDTLYTEASRVVSYVNENLYSMQQFNFDTAYTGKKYVGVRFLMPTKEFTSNGSVVRLNELAVIGSLKQPEATLTTGTYETTDTNDLLTGETNILHNKEIYSVFQNNNGETNTTAFAGTDKKVFTDGSLSSGSQLNGAIYYKDDSTPYNIAPYLTSEHYTDLTYSLDGLAEVSEIWVYGHKNPALATYAYQLFLSDSEDRLFSSEALVATYENTNYSTYQRFVFAEKQKGKRYFGIRFLTPLPMDSSFLAGSRYVRLTELAVIGEVKEETVRISADNYTQKADDGELKTDNNLLYNRKYNRIIQYNNGDYSGSVGAETDLKENPTAITDGGTDDSVRLLNQIYYNSDKTPKNTEPYTDPKYYTTLTYFLGGSSTVDAVWVYHHHNPELTTNVYQLYLSDNRDALYDESSLIATYENTGNKTRQKFTFPEPLTGKQYVGIKFLVSAPKETSFTVNALYLRIAQLAVFGEVNTVTTEDTSAFDPEKELYDSLHRKYDMNLVLGKTPQILANDGTGEKQIAPDRVSAINDESNSNGFFTTPRFAEYISSSKILYYKDGTERYLKLQFNMGTLCEVKHILIAHHTLEELRTLSYEIYLAKDKAELWKPESIIEDHKNTTREQCEEFQYDTPKVGQYIGLKIKYPTDESVIPTKDSNIVYTRLNEFAVFGNYEDPNYQPPKSYAIGETTDDYIAGLGTSLIYGKRPTIRFNGTPMTKSHYGNKETQFTDGIAAPHVDVTSPTSGTGKLNTTDGSNYLDIIYDWEEVKYDITGFLYIGMSNIASTQYYTGWYQVYIAEEYDDLFLEENMVFEYNWQEEFFERGHNVTFDEVKRGAYFAIRILNPVSGAVEYIAPRISEIGVYGKKAKIVVKPTNLASNMPIEAYTENSNGDLTEISEKNLTVKEVKKLTDNDTSSKAIIKTSKKVQILYNLCNDSVIDEFRLISNAKKYKVYATKDLNEIWDEDSLIYTYKGKGTNGLTLKKGKKVRYVRFEISDFGKELEISEIKCIGGDDQLLKYKKLSRTFKGEQISLASYNFESKKQEYLFSNVNGNMAKLFDSGYIAPVGFFGGTNNTEALDMVIVLDDVRNIDNISISFPKVLPGYSPSKFEIYTSEVLSEFDDGEFELEPTVSYDGEPVLGTYNVSFRPRLARAILIRFIAGAPDYDPYQNNAITLGITELEVSGTAVKGMQRDASFDSLLTFKDKKTGVIVDILKYDTNDIYTRAHSLKVEEVEATRKQKQNLASQGALKVIGDKVYNISLLDVNGNVLPDADGRYIRITLPCDIVKYGYPLIAQAVNNEVTAVEAVSLPECTYIEVENLKDANYLVAAYVSATDPYFEELGVEVPEDLLIPDNTLTPDSAPGYENSGNTEYNDFYGGTSPETGETVPTVAVILFVSAAGLFVVSRKKPI